jgi:hypothetical protein
MARKVETRFSEHVASVLAGLLGVGQEAVDREPPGEPRPDLTLNVGEVAFVVECKAVGDAANVGSALRQLKAFGTPEGKKRPKTLVPIVAVPFMGETGRRLAAEAGVSWIDLSGNAWIEAPGRQIRILGNKNRFTSSGRPADVFAPKSSRVIRAMLMDPQRAFTQVELAFVSGVDKGRISRLVPRLDSMGLVLRDGRSIRIKDASLALEAWREAYDLEKHDVRRGHVSVRGPQELIDKIARVSESAGVSWALTGLAAAWQLTQFAMFRLVSLYVHARPSEAWLSAIGFREEPRGANVWIVRPVDDGVFQGSSDAGGVSCVHPLQVYLDLKAHPERAPEAAQEIRRRFLTWKPA